MVSILKEKTKSLCPDCFQVINASVYEKSGAVFMGKRCPEHGEFECLVEKDPWLYKKLMNKEPLKQKRRFDNLMIAVTHSCNLSCPVCYLPNRETADLSLEKIKNTVSKFGGWLIRLSGGEPTVRDDLPEIIRFISEQKKVPVIITNGVKLAERNYLKKLKAAGLKQVHFSLNGFDDEVSKKINGKRLLKTKLKALDNLRREKMGVVISVMLEKGVNETELEKIYRYCLRNKFVHSLRVRTTAPIGRVAGNSEQIYLSEAIELMSDIIGVEKELLVEHSLYTRAKTEKAIAAKKRENQPQVVVPRDHLPCGMDISLMELFLQEKGIRKIQNTLLRKLKIIFMLIPKIGVRNTFSATFNMLKGIKPIVGLLINIRAWPNKYTMDLEEIERCPSSHFVSETGDIVPYCYGLTLNDNRFEL